VCYFCKTDFFAPKKPQTADIRGAGCQPAVGNFPIVGHAQRARRIMIATCSRVVTHGLVLPILATTLPAICPAAAQVIRQAASFVG